MSNTEAKSNTSKTRRLSVYFDRSGFCFSLEGLKMKTINAFAFYKLGASLGPLRVIGFLPREEQSAALLAASLQLNALKHNAQPPLDSLGRATTGVQVDVESATKNLAGDRGFITTDDEDCLAKGLNEFEAVFENEALAGLTYAVEQLRAYRMPMLVDGADRAFHPQALKALSDDILKDIKESGRCLAFELPTAAGIHMMRAFEKVLKRFYKLASGKEPGTRDIYTLIKELQDNGLAEPKTLSVVDQIRNLHRNPLAHTVFLDTNEAVELFDIAKSAITAMVLDPKVKFFT